MSVRLSIIIPTSGRRSLGRTLDSIRDQRLIEGDEVLLIGDGPQPLALELFQRSGLPGLYQETPETRDYGGTQRNRGLDLASGDYLLFMDDDDVFEEGAADLIRSALATHPGRPHLFRMRYASTGRLLWADRTLTLGNVSTQMIAFPNHPRLRRWDSRHGHDHRFLVDNVPLWPPDSLIWREEVIAIIRPHEGARTPGRRPFDPRSGPLPVEECPFREVDPGGGADEPARCRLLKVLGGIEDASLSEVRRDACSACCASFPPSPSVLNPVVASLLYTMGDRIVERGGVDGCDPDKAARLKIRTEQHL
jgi:hypothetical protein